ncbi:9425_t:CDS:2 [Funneliformis mosseae]|uniref:9425_t:CDS:1 n=1 Tax=Funneliformis mosseae TaxID=27381 RepID=A0A9N8ZCI9_FUNMO|nr:9425_t:CDS:2 [Funneliformis mosseae]
MPSLTVILLCNSSGINNIIWNQSKEIAKSKVHLSLSELITKINIKTTIIDKIGNSKSQRYFFKNLARYQSQDNKNHVISNDSGNNLKETSESIVGKVKRTLLTVDNIDLKKIFIDY